MKKEDECGLPGRTLHDAKHWPCLLSQPKQNGETLQYDLEAKKRDEKGHMMFKQKDKRAPSATRTLIQARTTNTKTNNIQRVIQRNQKLTIGLGITIKRNDYLLKQAADQ